MIPVGWMVAAGVALLGVYGAGRATGLAEGRRRGLAEAPLLLRMSLLGEGRCPICGAGAVGAAGDVGGIHGGGDEGT